MCSVQESLTPYGRFHLPRIQYSKFCSSWPSRNLNEVLICVCMDHIYEFTYFQITQTVFKLLQFLQLFYITKLSILNATGYIGYNTLSDNHPYQASEHEHCALDNAARRKSALCRARPRPPRPPARRRPRCARASFTAAAPPCAHSTSAAVAPENSSAPDLLQRVIGVLQRVIGVLQRVISVLTSEQCSTPKENSVHT